MANTLQRKTIAILATDGFEQVELTQPKKALEEAGARTQVISPKAGRIKGWNKKDWGEEVPSRRHARLRRSRKIRRSSFAGRGYESRSA